MGEPILTPKEMQAFLSELEFIQKEAGISILKGLGSNILGIGRRLSSPVKGMRKALTEMAPAKAIAAGTKSGRALQARVLKAQRAQRPGVESPIKAFKAKWLGPGQHLMTPTAEAGRIQRAAESLSRSGWTGEGRITKYLPFGSKSGYGLMGLQTLGEMASSDEPAEAAARGAGYVGGGILMHGLGIPGQLAALGMSSLAGRAARAAKQKGEI